MRAFGIIMMVGGVVLFGAAIDIIVAAPSAVLLEIALALIFGVGGTVVFSGGAIVLAVALARRPLRAAKDTAGPTPILEQR